MAGLGDVDDYFDDDLDALAGEEFLQLEEQALLATQRPPRPQPPPTATRTTDQGKKAGSNKQNFHAQNATSFASDYGDQDEVLDAGIVDAPNAAAVAVNRGQSDGQSQVLQRERWRQSRYSENVRENGINQGPQNVAPTTLAHRGATPSSSTHDMPRAPTAGYQPTTKPLDFKNTGESRSLEARVEQLLQEKEQWEEERQRLQESLKTVEGQMFGKTGEISIIRSNHARQEKEKEKIINDLKQQQAEREARHRQEIEQARKEKESLATNNKFLDHEMNDDTWQSLNRTRPNRSRTNNTASTPKRQRTTTIGDGFDDDELMASPSKSVAKAKATPKHGAKRKRNISDGSPGGSFQVQTDDDLMQEASNTLNAHLSDALPKQDSRFEFLQMFLSHRIQLGMKRTFETFSSFALPSKPNTALATLFMDQMTAQSVKRDDMDFPGTVGAIVLSIWSKCLEENYYQPVRYLVDLVKFTLLNGTLATVNNLLDDIARITQQTADINVIPRFRALSRNVKVGNGASVVPDEPSHDVDTQDCIELLLLTANLCASDLNLVKHFWNLIRVDFISMLLRVTQDIDNIIMTVKLLEPCIQDDQLGSIRPPDTSTSITAEQHIIDRLTSMLIEIPRPPVESEPYDPITIVDLRFEIFLLLEQLCDNKFSGRAFVAHPQALGRVVRAMSDELSSIYANLYGQEQRSEVVNHACRILFQVTTTHAEDFDLQEKLRSQPGGVNKYLIVLSRLAFSDAIFFERGIEDDVFDCAHQMLEDFVTPEEADALKKAFLRD